MCGPLPQADVVVMELGILHYFVDLQALLGKGEGESYIRNSTFSVGCLWGGWSTHWYCWKHTTLATLGICGAAIGLQTVVGQGRRGQG